MFCPRCGTSNAADARYCRSCANTFTTTGAAPPPPNAGPQQRPPANDLPYPGYQGHQNPSFQTPLSPPMQPSYAHSGYGQSQGASGRAIASLVLMLLGFFAGCGPLLSIPALIMGKLELDAIRTGRAPKAGEILAKFGFYGGIAVTLIYCALGLFYAALIGFVGFSTHFNF